MNTFTKILDVPDRAKKFSEIPQFRLTPFVPKWFISSRHRPFWPLRSLSVASWTAEGLSCPATAAPMIYILGVAHRAQAKRPEVQKTAAQDYFESCLRSTILEVHPAFVGEEDNEKFLADRGEISISKQVADEFGIEHRFCEPNNNERSAIGSRNYQSIALDLWMAENVMNDELELKARAIEIVRYFPIRERFWLQRLAGCRAEVAIFTCGDIHLKSFGVLLQTEGISFKIKKRGIGVSEEDDSYYRALQYLEAHPEVARDWSE